MAGEADGFGISIGAVARATGIPANTLRTWERRYSFPSPDRTDGGQRLYDPDVVDHLKLVARALDLGHRPSQVLRLPLSDVRGLVGAAGTRVVSGGATPVVADDWMSIVEALDGESLDAALRVEWARRGGMRFLVERAAPFIEAVGTGWMEGRLGILHEHLATERLRAFLASCWRGLSDRAAGPRAVLATLPDERHDLGLHMAATALALAGWRILYIGPDTPVLELVQAARQGAAAAVVISVSHTADPRRVRADLGRLLVSVPASVAVVVGGGGAPTDVQGTVYLDGLAALARWGARNLAAG